MWDTREKHELKHLLIKNTKIYKNYIAFSDQYSCNIYVLRKFLMYSSINL